MKVHAPAGFLEPLEQILAPAGDADLHLAKGNDTGSGLSDHARFRDAAFYVGRAEHHIGFAAGLSQYVAVVDAVLQCQLHGFRADQRRKMTDGVRVVVHLHGEEHQVLWL